MVMVPGPPKHPQYQCVHTSKEQETYLLSMKLLPPQVRQLVLLDPSENLMLMRGHVEEQTLQMLSGHEHGAPQPLLDELHQLRLSLQGLVPKYQ